VSGLVRKRSSAFSRRDRPRAIILAIAVAAYLANLLVGPNLYPEFSELIGWTVVMITFFAWLIDAIVTSVRIRLGARRK